MRPVHSSRRVSKSVSAGSAVNAALYLVSTASPLSTPKSTQPQVRRGPAKGVTATRQRTAAVSAVAQMSLLTETDMKRKSGLNAMAASTARAKPGRPGNQWARRNHVHTSAATPPANETSRTIHTDSVTGHGWPGRSTVQRRLSSGK
ncbi:MAG: hypothetical protein R2838_07060 [Caldilineaceae bacterium]